MTMPVGDPSHERFWDRHRREQEQQAVQVTAALQQLAQSFGGLRSALLAPPVDDVMFAGAVLIGAGGTARKTFTEAFASVMICNPSAGAVTVLGQVPNGAAPAQGAGIVRIPANSWRLAQLRSDHLVVVGAATTVVTVEVFLRHRQPGAGQWG